MDSYQPIYDAVRSRISNGNIGEVIREVAFQCFDISNMRALLQQDFCSAAQEMARPSVIFRPSLTRDGNQWCFLLGEDLHNGVAGFGDTPHAAAAAFDQAFWKETIEKKATHSPE
jgi:hypothetical protein